MMSYSRNTPGPSPPANSANITRMKATNAQSTGKIPVRVAHLIIVSGYEERYQIGAATIKEREWMAYSKLISMWKGDGMYAKTR